MVIPYIYSVKNVLARKRTTLLTVGGMALVVYVFATVLMLSEGLSATLVATGSPANVMVIRRGAETEVQSSISRTQASLVEVMPEVARGVDGAPLVSKESLVLMVLPKRGSAKPSNVVIRGLSRAGVAMRPQARLVGGRWFEAGAAEIVAGNKIAGNFKGAGLGESLRFALRDWRVVGVFDAGSTGFGSEIWADVDQLMQAFRRNDYSSVIFTLARPSALPEIKVRLAADPRLMLEPKRETEFYAEQSKVMATFLTVLGLTLSMIFSLGAIIGAVITMYASVASRTREIGTLRALGFTRASIWLAFLGEALVLGLVGGLCGLLPAAAMQFLTVSTMNWQTFAELAFSFTLTPAIAVKSLVFALAMGFVGGALPAARAAKLDIVDALRAA